MSRNAIALTTSDTKRLVGRSLTPAVELQKNELPSAADRIHQLKDLASALLNEVRGLEQDRLLLELSAAQDIYKLDIENGIRLDDIVRRFERNIIRQALIITSGNQSRAARLLGIKPNTLNYKIKIYNLNQPA
ncbi:MAG TPA: helix-turn-helix domain-containing protein [Pyrinomonadaceae bacterium]|nr:helix-turn-helix domain-containing protein [Pyrinomonadaceae bacterium]